MASVLRGNFYMSSLRGLHLVAARCCISLACTWRGRCSSRHLPYVVSSRALLGGSTVLHLFSLFLAWPALFAASFSMSPLCFTQWQQGTSSVLACCWRGRRSSRHTSLGRFFANFLVTARHCVNFTCTQPKKKKKKSIPRRDDGVSLPRWQLQSPMS